MAEVQNKIKYIRFPISFIRDMLVDKETGIRKMILYGYSLVADKSEINERNAYQQAMYCFYRYDAKCDEEPGDKRLALPYYIWNEIRTLADYGSIEIDEDRFGFDGSGDFNVDTEVSALIDFGEKNQKFHNMVMDWYRLRQTADLFGLHISNQDAMLNEYRKYCGREAKNTRMVSVKLSQLLEYLFQRKDEKQIMVFAAYMGVKGIIGNKPFARTTERYIIANMFGCMDEVELQTMLSKPGNEILSDLHSKYTTRKKFDGIKKELNENNFIPQWLSYGKAGTFVSCKLNHKQFVREVAKVLDERENRQNATRPSAKDYRRAIRFEVEEIRNHASG